MAQPLAVDDPAFATGPGWTAHITTRLITLTVLPDVEDALEDAIEYLLAKSRQRYWTCEFSNVTNGGCDVWLLRRCW